MSWFEYFGQGELRAVCHDIARALVPAAFSIFQRQRWCLNFGSLGRIALLLSIFDGKLGKVVVGQWLRILGSSKAIATRRTSADDAPSLQPIAGADPQASFAEENEQKRMTVQELIDADAGDLLLAGVICGTGMVTTFRHWIWMSSTEFDEQQLYEVSLGKPGKFRVLEAYSGRMFSNFITRQRALLDGSAKDWELICNDRKKNSTLFAMLGRGLGSMHYYNIEPSSKCPV